ncbi:MAG: PQQ-dependent sugar dehydrogenase [Geodermatophilaceae bacterium]|nr:PQQ-dependent sugar dehydrogenase [Geodermatophilaceae bacterium]
MGRHRARLGTAAALLTALGLLAGCGGSEYTPAGPWQPQLDGPPPAVAPPEDAQPLPEDPSDPSAPSGPSDPDAPDPNVVATDLDTPWGLALLPDGSAIVGERRTGRILQVFPDAAAPVVLMTVAGLEVTGDGGLLGLALSPAYLEDGLVYAYATTAADNRILRFTLGGTPKPIVTGIPKGATGNGGRIAFGPDELLYVGTGDTGDPALAADPVSLAGKVLRYDIFGTPEPLPGTPGSPVWTRGHSNVTGLCFDGADRLFTTETGQPGDEFNLLSADGDFGWPDPTTGTDPVGSFADAGLGGCGILGRAAYFGSLTGEELVSVVLDGNGALVGEPETYLDGRYGRLRSVVVDPLGVLWLTTSNLDGPGEPDPDDDRVLRILAPTDGGEEVT